MEGRHRFSPSVCLSKYVNSIIISSISAFLTGKGKVTVGKLGDKT